MTSYRTCSTCGAPLVDGETEAPICVACSRELGLADETAASADPDTGPSDSLAGEQRLPESIGPYRILQVLGEGGMGLVYLAEQTEPIRRRVALKVIKAGMDTRAVIGRFESERQALALMSHPTIAQVLDAGETRGGRPYFVMELVEGEPITAYCDRRRLSLERRLGLFVQVCEGVQHAHQKGVIHRDLKPSNVMVADRDGDPTPKIIDFGVAKAVEQRPGERSIYTELGMLVGTPEYMSPEQAEMSPLGLDTRTDVYSLGVLLYELLIGVLPFDRARLQAAGFDEVRRIIREQDPPTPSSRLQTLGEASTEHARRRRLEVSTLKRCLAGDLDWITMKALEKDRTRRYGSPLSLAEDVTRYLRHEPVIARPPSLGYQLAKFVRRNKLLVSGLAAVALALVAGAATATVFALSEARQRREADRARADLAEVVHFQSDMLANVDPAETGRRLLAQLNERVGEAERRRSGDVERARRELAHALRGVNTTDVARWLLEENVLDPAAEVIDTRFADQPLIAARLRHELGDTYRQLGLFNEGRTHLERALELRSRELGTEHPDTLSTIGALGVLHLDRGAAAEAEALQRANLETRRRVLGPEHPDTLHSLNNLGLAVAHQGRYEESEELLLQALELRRRTLGEDHPDTLGSLNNLAMAVQQLSRYDQAEAMFVDLVEKKRRLLGDDHFEVARALHNVASIQMSQQRYDDAERTMLEALEGYRSTRGAEHPITLRALNDLGYLYDLVDRSDEAAAIHTEVLEGFRRVLGEGHPEALVALMDLGISYTDMGRHAEAERLLRQAVAETREALGDRHTYTLGAINALGGLYVDIGRLDEAASLLYEALEGRMATHGPDAPDTVLSMNNVVYVFGLVGRHAEAGKWAVQLVETCDRLYGASDMKTLRARSMLADHYRTMGLPGQAADVFRQMLDALREIHPEDHPLVLGVLNGYVVALLEVEPFDPDDRTALELALELNRLDGSERAEHLDTLALAYFKTGDPQRAQETQQRALDALPAEHEEQRPEMEQRLARYRAAAR